MTITSLGDLTTHFMLRRHNVALRDEVQRLSQELSTGETSNPINHLSGDFAALADLEKRSTLNAVFRQSAREAGNMTDAMQQTLSNLQEMSGELATAMVSLSESGVSETVGPGAAQARDVLDRAVALLNTRVAGRSLFAGDAVDSVAMTTGDAIMASLKSSVAGLTSTDDIHDAVDTWFDAPGGGFETVAYQGSGRSIPAFRVAPDQSATLDVRADHQALRDVLKPIALAALADDPALDMTTRRALLASSGTALLDTQDGLTALRADLGVTEARLEETSVRLASEKLALEESRGTLLSVDPYETATRLEQAQSNLESLYTVTVRLSRLSLTEFM
jgi:flagellar hook-associated protein 3 FlgL